MSDIICPVATCCTVRIYVINLRKKAFIIRPEEIYQHKTHRLKATRLRELVLSAQSGNSAATELLCRTFKPLIRQEIRGYVSRILGEDAENTAWEIFLTFIVNYRGWDYRRLPGLIKSHLHYELLHAVAKEINQAEPFDPELYDEEQTAACSELNSAEVRLLLDDCMCKLTPKQKLFVDSVCLGGKTLREAGAAFGCTPQNSYKHLSRGLETLRRELLT